MADTRIAFVKMLWDGFQKLLPSPTKAVWQYGTCNGRRARRHRINKNVQFVLWKAGEKGHKEDYWHDFGPGWESKFIPDEK